MSKVASEKSNGKASRLRDSRRHLRRVTEESEGEEREHVLDQVAIAERFLKAFARSELDYAGGAGVPREGYAHHVAERVARRLLEDLAWPRTPSVMSAAELVETFGISDEEARETVAMYERERVERGALVGSEVLAAERRYRRQVDPAAVVEAIALAIGADYSGGANRRPGPFLPHDAPVLPRRDAYQNVCRAFGFTVAAKTRAPR